MIMKGFFHKCDEISRKLRIWLHLLKKSLMDNFFFLCSGLCTFENPLNRYLWSPNYFYHVGFLISSSPNCRRNQLWIQSQNQNQYSRWPKVRSTICLRFLSFYTNSQTSMQIDSLVARQAAKWKPGRNSLSFEHSNCLQ